jgi:serine/threonine-protein kinase
MYPAPMQEPPIPEDEATRLELLRACKIMYTPGEQAFDDVARLAAELCGTEIALITLVDSDYQWFKAKVGVTQAGTARDLSFCGHCIAAREPMIVEDTHLDPRFADNPLVTGDPHLRFYAGVPLEVEPGSAIGALSVADRRPRTMPARQLESLRRLAAQVSRELRLRRDLERTQPPPPPPDDVPLGPGSVIDGKWRVAREVGRGMVGAVYEAHDEDGQRAAVKVLLPVWRNNTRFLERFAREARVLMRLESPHVGRLIDVGNLEIARGDLPYLVLEYLDGLDLDHLVEGGRSVDYRQAFAWGADACDGVAAAHELGVVHRDLKPSNIFLADTGEAAPTVKVLDFGMAHGDPSLAPGVKLTRESDQLGSPAYMSPEQMVASHDVDARTDVWSMGALLYELVSGRLPFAGATQLAMFANVMTAHPEPLPDAVPPAAREIVLRCLQKDRASRYDSMRELAAALRTAPPW